jgi:FkbM family methyltransferase
MKNDFSDEFGGVNFIDLGCSGGLDPRWAPFERFINYTGFDSRKDACEELQSKKWPYRTAQFLPYAIAGEDQEMSLYLTKSPFCTSLRKPNMPWLKRFTFHAGFNIENIEKIKCITMDTLAKNENIRADIMKIDIQGMEGPVLKSSNCLFDELIVLEVESGFTRNYEEESVFWEINQLMEARGFIMYEIF